MSSRSPAMSPASLNESFKNAMARVSSQAMVLTAATLVAEPQCLHGMTLSLVCSLLVYPKPLLQFNLHLPSYTSSSLHSNEYLALHLLPPTSESVKLGRIFAKGVKLDRRHIDFHDADGLPFHEMTTPFLELAESEYHLVLVDKTQIPILNEAERVFLCKKHAVFEVDNHEIWVVAVEHILLPNKRFKGDITKTGGMLYYNREFHKIGKPLLE